MELDIGRLRRAHWLVGGGALALFVFMFFFKWLGYSSNLSSVQGVKIGGDFSYNAWHSFSNSRWIWLITVLVAIGAVLLVAAQQELNLPVKTSVIVTGIGALSVILILYRIIDHPHLSAGFGSLHASFGIKIGIWLGLVAALAITYGGYLWMQEDETSLGDVRDQAAKAASTFTTHTQSAPPPSEPAAQPSPPIPSPPTTAPPSPPPTQEG